MPLTPLKSGEGENAPGRGGSLVGEMNAAADGLFVVCNIMLQLCRGTACKEVRQTPGEVVVAVLRKNHRLEGIQIADLAFIFFQAVDPTGCRIRAGSALLFLEIFPQQ
jgi:hypothetical protein